MFLTCPIFARIIVNVMHNNSFHFYTYIVLYTAPRDYTSTERTLTFGPGNTRQPVTVPINNDDIVEDLENFFASLTLMTDNVSVIVTPDEATVTIFDRDGEAE